MDESAKAKRRALINRLFGEGIPHLWCPPPTHYTYDGDYHKWLRTVGGCYDGFLLGSGNCFAGHLKSIIENLWAGLRCRIVNRSGRLRRSGPDFLDRQGKPAGFSHCAGY